MTSERSFTEQTAVITGASSGIGRCIALELARRGMNLCLIGRDRDALLSLSKEVDPTRKCSILQADFANDNQIASLRDQLENEIPSLDVLIHSAGAYSTAAFSDATAEMFDSLYRVNVRAPFLLTQWLLPKLIRSQGQVVFINSSVVMQAKARLAQYAATKQALKAIADSLRDEVNADGVRVLSIYPGRTATPMQASIFKQEGRKYIPENLTQPSDIADVVIHALLLPRSAEITDLHIRPMRK